MKRQIESVKLFEAKMHAAGVLGILRGALERKRNGTDTAKEPWVKITDHAVEQSIEDLEKMFAALGTAKYV